MLAPTESNPPALRADRARGAVRPLAAALLLLAAGSSALVAADCGNWQAWAALHRKEPILSLEGTFRVPQPPPNQEEQTMFVSLGLQDAWPDGTELLMPVLQWGGGGLAGGGPYWALTNWYQSEAGLVFGNLARVESGDQVTVKIGKQKINGVELWVSRAVTGGGVETELRVMSDLDLRAAFTAFEMPGWPKACGALPASPAIVFDEIVLETASGKLEGAGWTTCASPGGCPLAVSAAPGRVGVRIGGGGKGGGGGGGAAPADPSSGTPPAWP